LLLRVQHHKWRKMHLMVTTFTTQLPKQGFTNQHRLTKKGTAIPLTILIQEVIRNTIWIMPLV
jgi:hypothetical protein